MCGRMQHEDRPSWRQIHSYYGAFVPKKLPQPKGDVMPSDPVPIVAVREGERRMTGARWGFVPRYVDELSSDIRNRMFNARDDSLRQGYNHWLSLPFSMKNHKGPYVASLLDGQKCLLPMNAYYEFNDRRPYRFTLKDRPIFSVAGLWEWNAKLRILSCTMMTTDPSAACYRIHDRMPVILNPDQYDCWLRPDTPIEKALSLLRPYKGDDLRIEPVHLPMDDQINMF